MSFSWVNMVPSSILVMLLDSDPDSGNLESFVRSDFINDITSDLVFVCIPALTK